MIVCSSMVVVVSVIESSVSLSRLSRPASTSDIEQQIVGEIEADYTTNESAALLAIWKCVAFG